MDAIYPKKSASIWGQVCLPKLPVKKLISFTSSIGNDQPWPWAPYSAWHNWNLYKLLSPGCVANLMDRSPGK
jgi:hypothetical protein